MAKDPGAAKKPAKKKPAASNGAPPPTMTPPRRMQPPPRRPPMPQLPPGGDEDGLEGDMGLMPPSPTQRIAEWIESTVFPRNKHSVTIQLCHWSMNGEMPAREWQMSEDFAEEDPASIAETVYGYASEDAGNQESPSARYSVNALDSNGRRFARVIITVEQEGLDPGAGRMGGESEERHTQEGHLAQSYRHTEQFARMALAMQLSTARQNLELHRELGTTRTQLHQQQIQAVELFQNMKDREMLRKVVMGKHQRAEMVKDAAMGLVIKFAPHVAQRIGLMTDDEAAQLQTSDAVSDWLAAMSEDEARRMIQGTPDAAKRQAFERAWIIAKKRAVARAARAALSGKAAPTQLGSGAAANDASAAKPAEDKGIQFTAEESMVINKTTLIVINLLISVDDTIYGMVLPRVPAGAHEEINGIRQRIKSEGDLALSKNEWQAATVNLRPYVIKMLGDASDQDIRLMLTQIENPNHKLTVQQAHKLVGDKLKATAA